MINKKWRKALQPKNVVLATVLAVASVSVIAQNLPDLGLTSGDPWNAELYYENHTALRDKAGLSKFRNTLQSEMSKNLNNGWRFRGILRGTYDGVYDLNKDEYGKNAGGAVEMGNAGGSAGFLGGVAGLAGAYDNGVPALGVLSGAQYYWAIANNQSPTTTNTNIPALTSNLLNGYSGLPAPLAAITAGNQTSTVGYGAGIGSTAVAVFYNLAGPWGNHYLGGLGVHPVGYGLTGSAASANPSQNTYAFPASLGTATVNGSGFANSLAAINPNNTNTGLKQLGSNWNNSNISSVGLAVPARPCNYDNRGCLDFGGYGNKTQAQLASPEFNSRLDFIREAYVTKTIGLDGGESAFLKIGKQQVVWGRTDLFRVLDVINPVDYSRNNIYDELQDIRIPMWIAQAEYRMGGSESMQDRNLSAVWNFDQFRPNNLGQGGTPNSILGAGDFFRSMANCWYNGCTVSNFANGGAVATNFGPGVIGIRNVDLPNWSLANTQLGVKYEGVTKEGLSFSLNALTYRSQLPSLHGGIGATNPFTGAQTTSTPYLIGFDVVYPRVNLVGGSMDFQVESLGAAMRLEGAYTSGEEFANTLKPQLYSKNNVWRSVIGFDRPTFIPFISTDRTVLFSGQLFYQHIFQHQLEQSSLGQVGMPDWKDNAIATLLVKAFLMQDRLSPEVIFARDFRAQSSVVAPAVEWMFSDNLKLKFGANVKIKDSTRQNTFDDCRSCNPFNPYTAYAGQTEAGSAGLGGGNPLGMFRAGPIGTAFAQDEIYMTLRYKF